MTSRLTVYISHRWICDTHFRKIQYHLEKCRRQFQSKLDIVKIDLNNSLKKKLKPFDLGCMVFMIFPPSLIYEIPLVSSQWRQFDYNLTKAENGHRFFKHLCSCSQVSWSSCKGTYLYGTARFHAYSAIHNRLTLTYLRSIVHILCPIVDLYIWISIVHRWKAERSKCC